MIRYALACDQGHGFEGWFSDSADFDVQQAQGRLTCPMCESRNVAKQIMAPAVACRGSGRDVAEAEGDPARIAALMRKIRAHVEENFDYVGDRFAAEARAIHAGEAEARGVYGEASPSEVKALLDDGVPVAPLPPAPPRKTELN